jgi:DNA-binding LacI/PurR family transcriptional regulator
MARSLKTKKSHQLAVLVNDLGNPFESGILLHIESAARQKGYTVFFQPYIEDQEEQLKSQFKGRIDGLLSLGQSLKKTTLTHFNNMGIPVLSITTPVVGHPEVPAIDLDWELEYARLIRHLKECGHQRIAFMANGNVRHHHEHRFQAFLHAMKWEQCSFEEHFLMFGRGKLEQAYPATKEVLSKLLPDLPFTAIVCANDLMAAGVIAACRDMDVEVPATLAVAGCEDILMSSHTSPMLTTIHYPREHLNVPAIDMLLKLMNGEIVGNVTMEADLIVRASTRLAK